MQELEKISHRAYSTGFYYGTPVNAQTYPTAGYVRDYEVVAVVEGYENGYVLASLKNKFAASEELDCLEPGSRPFTVPTDGLQDGEGAPLAVANQPTMRLRIPFERPIAAGSLLRRRTVG